MTREWKPGDVALAKYDGEPPMLYVYSKVFGKDEHRWQNAMTGRHSYTFEAADWHRSLVVIDPEDREQVERLRDYCWRGGTVDDWQNHLREFANPTPPKPDEPTGLGAVVEDADGNRWVLYTTPDSTAPWCDGMTSYEWDEVDAVRVLSEGVQ